MKKCGYCGKEVKGELNFCSDGCEKSYKDENEKDERRIKYFAGGIVLGLLVIAVSAFTKSVFMVGIGVIIMGIVVFFTAVYHAGDHCFFGVQKGKDRRQNSRYSIDSSRNMGRAHLSRKPISFSAQRRNHAGSYFC